MKWEINPITEEKIAKIITEYWPYLTPDEKLYMKELHLTICVTNYKWEVDLGKIVEAVGKRKRQQGQEETEDEEIEEYEEEPIEPEPQVPMKKKPHPQYKYIQKKAGE